MQKVTVVTGFFVEATGTKYKAGSKQEVSDELYRKHGAKGTGFLEPAATADEVKTPDSLKKVKK